jgi:hypothetical protein
MATSWTATHVRQDAYRTCLAEQPAGLQLVCLAGGARRFFKGDLTTPSTYDTIDFRGFNTETLLRLQGLHRKRPPAHRIWNSRLVSLEWNNRKRTRPSRTHRVAVGGR